MTSNGKGILVRVFCDTNGTHVHQLYSGLYELEKKGKLSLEHRFVRPPWMTSRPTRQFLYIEVQYAGVEKAVCFDMNDGLDIAVPEALDNVSFYYKRSYHSGSAEAAGRLGMRSVILPFGLNYQVGASSGRLFLLRVLSELYCWPYNPLKGTNRAHSKNVIQFLSDGFLPSNRKRDILDFSDFEVHPDIECDPNIFFQCRLWDPDWFPKSAQEHIKLLNEMRVLLVRKLRRYFGSNFVGGLQPHQYSLSYAPELVCEFPTDRKSFLKSMHRNLITIASTGIAGSIGWKFAEYLAASRCIVSEPLEFELPGDFTASENYLIYETVDQCIDSCEKILNDKVLENRMRNKNYEYYRKYVRPEGVMMTCLDNVISEIKFKSHEIYPFIRDASI